jgi:hypothetical protein
MRLGLQRSFVEEVGDFFASFIGTLGGWFGWDMYIASLKKLGLKRC